MKLKQPLIGIGLAVLCTTAFAGEIPGQVSGGPYLCWGIAQHAKETTRLASYFYTDVIEVTAPQAGPLSEAWIAHLEELHPGWYFQAKGCTLLPNEATKRQIVIDATAAQWNNMNPEKVHTNWSFTPLQKSAADDAPTVFCQALRSDNKDWYVSPLFPAATADEETAAANAWRTCLKGNKDPDVYVVVESYLSGCDGPGPANAMKHQKAARAEQIADGGGRVVETGWLPAGVHVGSSAAAVPQQSAAANSQFYQCYLAAFGANYMTPAFPSTKDIQTLNADWRAYILKAHTTQGVARTGCAATTEKAAANSLSQVGYKRENWSD